MDILWFSRLRITFTSDLYDAASAPFREKMRKLEAVLTPANPEYDDVDEPAFLQEFLEASEAVEAIGHWCFLMLYASFQVFLREYVAAMARTHGIKLNELWARLDAPKKTNWFERHRLLFLGEFRVEPRSRPGTRQLILGVRPKSFAQDATIHLTQVTLTHRGN